MSVWIDVGSVWRGIRAMRWSHGKVNYAVRRNSGWWCHLWTPVWHEGRGPYMSIGLGIVAFYRGY